ncbi:integrase [Caulobacter rhizosphaerae]|nr:integrase [Caulobacter rhizosphaerae]
MSDNAIATVAASDCVPFASLAKPLRDYAHAATSPSTRRAYESALREWQAWCASVDVAPLPADPAHVALYLTARAATLATSTLAKHLAAIRWSHTESGIVAPAHPDLDRVWAGIRRQHGRPPRKKRALRTEDLKTVLKRLPAGNAGVRDRALLLLGFSGALRRDELAQLAVDGPIGGEHRVVFVSDGVELHLGRTKGDQEGRGAVVAIPFGKSVCPVAALQAWISLAKIRDGALWLHIDKHDNILRSPIGEKAMVRIVKRAVSRAGFDPSQFAGHSLRRGFLTSAALGGASGDQLMRHARHKDVNTTMGYVEEAERFKKSAARKTGL